MREQQIRLAIQNLATELFESFAREILRQSLYPGLNPTSKSHDLGEDARTEDSTVFLHQRERVSLFVSKTATWKKLEDDCKRCIETKRQIDKVVFVTSGDPRTDIEDEWKRKVKAQFNWDLEIWTVRYLAPEANCPQYDRLVDEYLYIPPPGGDFASDVASNFSRLTARAIKQTNRCITSISGAFVRPEISQIELLLEEDKPLILTGEAGSGKSGLGADLAEASQSKNIKKAVFLLDASLLAGVESQIELQQKLWLKGEVVQAVERLARYSKGCRLIIDQFDSLISSKAEQLLQDLIIECSESVRVEVVVICRNQNDQERTAIERFCQAGFTEVKSQPLTEEKVRSALAQLGITAITPLLITLGQNLLNLDLIALINKVSFSFDFSRLLDEIDLWENFLIVIQQRERLIAPQNGELLIAEAAKLARIGLKSEDRTFLLDFPLTSVQKRLQSWNIILQIEELLYRFRHEKLQEFFYTQDVVRRLVKPDVILAEINPHKTQGVFRWADTLRQRRNSPSRASFLHEIFAPSSSVPFYVQAAVLERYIHRPNPAEDAIGLAVILEVLKARLDLRNYFFRRRPAAAWAITLWDNGFFDTPPELQKMRDNYIVPAWDVQQYLISVAEHAPDVVVKHLKALPQLENYVAAAFEAASRISIELVEEVLPDIIQWIEKTPYITVTLAPLQELIQRLAKDRHFAAALHLFQVLTLPHLPVNYGENTPRLYYYRTERVSKLENNWEEERLLHDGIKVLLDYDPAQIVFILEAQLLLALQLEAGTPAPNNYKATAWWRKAIEDSEQDIHQFYKEQLLRGLRDAVENWILADPLATISLIKRYLDEDHLILRRMGLYFLARFPAHYPELVSNELNKISNLNETAIHHEFFLLLENGFPIIPKSQQNQLLKAIVAGPPEEETQQLAEWVQKEHNIKIQTYIQEHNGVWIRDRLWMLRKHLKANYIRLLNKLIAKRGEPKHPEFNSWLESYVVNQASPLPEEQLAQFTPQELAAFVSQWRPASADEHAPVVVSYQGLGRAIATVIVPNLEKYVGVLMAIATSHPQLAEALLGHSVQKTPITPVEWEILLGLSEKLLADEVVCQTEEWIQPRHEIVKLIETALTDADEILFPPTLLPRVCALLLTLIDDPSSPETRQEALEERFKEHDPATIAVNYVSYPALAALINYAVRVAKLNQAGKPEKVSPPLVADRLEPKVREVLSRKLEEARAKPDYAMHSVFGRYFYRLKWLDEEWVKAKLNRIFPAGVQGTERWLFVAAWDSYVIFNLYHNPMPKFLRPVYRQAIVNLGEGYTSKTHLEPDKKLAQHLIWEYLLADYDLSSAEGQDSLLALFFHFAPNRARASVGWWLWRIACDNQDDFEKYWPRIKALWEWRNQFAAEANHPADLDEEMKWYTYLLRAASHQENIDVLIYLLDGLLPHITRTALRDRGRDEVIKYFAREIQNSPVKVIQAFRKLQEHLQPPYWYEAEEKARQILEIAAAHPDARAEALLVLDLLGRRGDDRFYDIYQRYS